MPLFTHMIDSLMTFWLCQNYRKESVIHVEPFFWEEGINGFNVNGSCEKYVVYEVTMVEDIYFTEILFCKIGSKICIVSISRT